MSYKNPSRIINRQAQAIQAGGERIQNQVLETAGEYAAGVALQKKQLEELEEENVQLESNLIDNANSATKNWSGADQEVVGLFDGLIDQRMEIKRLVDLGPKRGGISKRDGMLRTKEIEGAPEQFAAEAKYIAGQVQDYGAALNDSSLSSIGSVETKAVLNALHQKQDVKIHREGGEFFYYLPKKDAQGNLLPWPDNEGKLNGTVLMDKAAEGKDLFSKKQDISGVIDLAWEKNNEAELGDLGEYIKEEVVRNGSIHPVTGEVIEMEEGYEQVITLPRTDNRDKYIEKVESSSMLTPLLGDQKKMLSVWQDTIDDGEETGVDPVTGSKIYTPNSLGSFAQEGNELGISLTDMGLTMDQWQNSVYGEYPTGIGDDQKALIQQNQSKAAKRYMANLSWDKNSLAAGGHSSSGKRKIVEKAEPNSSTKRTFKGEGGKDYSNTETNNIRAGIAAENKIIKDFEYVTDATEDSTREEKMASLQSKIKAQADVDDMLGPDVITVSDYDNKDELIEAIARVKLEGDKSVKNYDTYKIGRDDYQKFNSGNKPNMPQEEFNKKYAALAPGESFVAMVNGKLQKIKKPKS